VISVEIKTTSEIIKNRCSGEVSFTEQRWVNADRLSVYLNNLKLPRVRGLTEYGKGLQEGASMIINLLQRDLNADKNYPLNHCSGCGKFNKDCECDKDV